jgi:DNA repair protein RadC
MEEDRSMSIPSTTCVDDPTLRSRRRKARRVSYPPVTELPTQDLVRLVAGESAAQVYRVSASLRALLDTPTTLSAAARCRLVAARELIARTLQEQLAEGELLNSPAAVRDLLRLRLGSLEHEEFWCLFLTTGHRLIAAERLFRGTLDQTSVHPREVVKRALRHNCAAIIFAHNHVGHSVEPSDADRLLTNALKQALHLVGVRVLDHFIVCTAATTSFAERGLL